MDTMEYKTQKLKEKKKKKTKTKFERERRSQNELTYNGVLPLIGVAVRRTRTDSIVTLQVT